MKDFLSNRKINIKEKVLVVKDRVYAKESYIAIDTRKLKNYPEKVFYDKNHQYLAKLGDEGVFELDDIEDILISYEDTCFSNHDLEDLRKFLINKRKDLYRNLEKNSR